MERNYSEENNVMNNQTMLFLGARETQVMGHAGRDNTRNNVFEMSDQEFAKQFEKLYDYMDSVFSQIQKKGKKRNRQFELDEIELKVDVSLKAGIRIVASAEIETTGGITLTFKRKQKDEY